MEPPELPDAILAVETVHHLLTAWVFKDKLTTVVDDAIDLRSKVLLPWWALSFRSMRSAET